MHSTAIRRVVAVVPACNEETSIGAAVAAIQAAASHLPKHVQVDIVAVANGCTDGTEAVARGAGAHVLDCPQPNVGAARATGVAWALGGTIDPSELWIASTDADSVVPEQWLISQLEAADGGADVFLGTVTLAPTDLGRHRSWFRRYVERLDGQPHQHVHGANLGVRASAYVAAGGFRHLSLHEDADLVARLVDSGAVTAWIDTVPVMTSARHHARVTGGVGSDLAASVQLSG